MSSKPYFEQASVWDNYDTGDDIRKKIEFILEWIPSDVKTILDVGCGNGKITNVLAKHWEVTGLDFSSEALKYVEAETIQASATAIPLADRQFDLVLSSEMIEHLTKTDAGLAFAEMKRVSKKYVLISVPNQEYLELNYIRCPQCSKPFHVWHHMDNYDISKLDRHFTNYRRLKLKYFGPVEQRWIPLLLKIRQSIGKQWFTPNQNTVCSHCQNKDFKPNNSNIITKLCNGINKVICGMKPYWLMALYEKKQ